MLVDYATRCVEGKRLRSKTPAGVEAFLNEVLSTHGFPKQLLSDNGHEFKNSTIAAFCQSHEFQQLHSAPEFPRQNGLAERAVSSVEETLSRLSVYSPDKLLDGRYRLSAPRSYRRERSVIL